MTLDEAIEHAREVERTCEDTRCAAEHAQLAEWLSLLKVYTDTHMAEEVQRARHEMHGWQLEWKREMERREELEAENAKLREELAEWERLAAGIDLPEYPVTQFEPKDLERENAKLRELVRHMGVCIQHLNRIDEDGGCVLCPYQSVEHDCEFESRMLELGIEVEE